MIERPGPVYDTLGEIRSTASRSRSSTSPAQQTYPTEGELNLLTVSVVGSPGGAAELDRGRRAPGSTRVAPSCRSTRVYPDGQTQEQADAGERRGDGRTRSRRPSRRPSTSSASTTRATSPSTACSRTPRPTACSRPATNCSTVERRRDRRDHGTARRDLAERRRIGRWRSRCSATAPSVSCRSRRSRPPRHDPTPVIGIQAGYLFPFDVTIQLDNVGGPSAGMMFALGIVRQAHAGRDDRRRRTSRAPARSEPTAASGRSAASGRRCSERRTAGADSVPRTRPRTATRWSGHIPADSRSSRWRRSTRRSRVVRDERATSGSSTSELASVRRLGCDPNRLRRRYRRHSQEPP